MRNRDRYKGGGRSGRVEEAIIEKVLEQIDEGGFDGDIDEAQWQQLYQGKTLTHCNTDLQLVTGPGLDVSLLLVN